MSMLAGGKQIVSAGGMLSGCRARRARSRVAGMLMGVLRMVVRGRGMSMCRRGAGGGAWVCGVIWYGF